MKKLLIASASSVYGSGYLDYISETLVTFFKSTDTILFIAYARPSGIRLAAYTEIAQKAFHKIGKKVIGLHEFKNPEKALKNAKGIFVGGGNSFVLLNELYKLNLMQALKSVIISGTPYLGTSAGSNLCGPSIGTSNDMPIVYPPSFKALGIIPFNINPHYIDPQPESKHMGETRATRIKEFHHYNSQSVLGLREGSFLEITGDEITLKGTLKARVFKQGVLAYEIDSETDLSDFK